MRDPLGLVRTARAGEQDGELVTGETGHRVGVADAADHALAEEPDQGVTALVAEVVVGRLEVVDVEEQHRRRRAGLPAGDVGLGQPLHEEGTVRQAGERVVEGLVAQPVLQLLAPLHGAQEAVEGTAGLADLVVGVDGDPLEHRCGPVAGAGGGGDHARRRPQVAAEHLHPAADDPAAERVVHRTDQEAGHQAGRGEQRAVGDGLRHAEQHGERREHEADGQPETDHVDGHVPEHPGGQAEAPAGTRPGPGAGVVHRHAGQIGRGPAWLEEPAGA